MSRMGWTLGSDIGAFTAAAGPFLRARPVEHSLPLTIVDTLLRRGADAYGEHPPLFAWWRPDGGGEVAGAALCTPPFPPLLTALPDAAARELAVLWPYGNGSRAGDTRGADLPGGVAGVNGEHAAATAFAHTWCERTGLGCTVDRRNRLYRLGALTPRVPAPPGRARVADARDRELLIRWQNAFGAEVGVVIPRGDQGVDDALAHGGRTLWETPDGEPVAVAGATPPSGGTVRVVAVYTPPEHRGRGYAGAATTAVSQAALDAGASDVVLFADLANPVSNSLYQGLGYAPVADFAELVFTAGA